MGFANESAVCVGPCRRCVQRPEEARVTLPLLSSCLHGTIIVRATAWQLPSQLVSSWVYWSHNSIDSDSATCQLTLAEKPYANCVGLTRSPARCDEPPTVLAAHQRTVRRVLALHACGLNLTCSKCLCERKYYQVSHL